MDVSHYICYTTKLRETPKSPNYHPLLGNFQRGTRLIAVANGKKVRDDVLERKEQKWTIRSQAPKGVMVSLWRRFRDYMVVGLSSLTNCNEGLRYSPAFDESHWNNRLTEIKFILSSTAGLKRLLPASLIISYRKIKEMNRPHAQIAGNP